VLHDINVSDPILTAPSGYNVCLRVGRLDVKINFVPKFDILGPTEVFFALGWQRTLVFEDKVYVWCGCGLR